MPGVDNFAHVGGLIIGTLSSVIVLNRIPMEETHGKKKVNVWYSEIIQFVEVSSLWIVRVICGMIVATFFIGGFIIFYKTDIGDKCSWCKYLACAPFWKLCKRK